MEEDKRVLKDDCRYDSLKRHQGATFCFAKYEAPSENWDHDHCIGCWTKFADFGGPDVLHEGYVHREAYEPKPEPEFISQSIEAGMRCIPAPLLMGYKLHWLCAECFNDFQEALGFSLELRES